MTTNQTIDGDKLAVPLTAEQFVKGYCERSGISLSEFYEAMVPMPDPRSPAGWAAVSNNPLCVKAHVELYSPEASKLAAQANGEPVAMSREQFEAWVLGRAHPTYGWLDKHWLARGDNPHTYADPYVQGLWVASGSLYAEQPAPVAVVLPERRALSPQSGNFYARGWNACLDELKRLNPSL